MVVDGRGDHVVRDGLVEEEALGEAVFGDVADVGVDRLLDGGDLDLLAVDEHPSAVDREEAEEGLRDFGSPRSEESGDSEDLAFFHGE